MSISKMAMCKLVISKLAKKHVLQLLCIFTHYQFTFDLLAF